jgi:hypothetical protein
MRMFGFFDHLFDIAYFGHATTIQHNNMITNLIYRREVMTDV